MLHVNRVARLSVVDAERVQIRFPQNDHFTVRFNSEVMEKIALTTEKLDEAGWRHRFEIFGVPKEHTEQLLDSLVGAGLIIRSTLPEIEMLGELWEHEHSLTKAVKFGLEVPMITTVGVVGEGLIAGWASKAADQKPLVLAAPEVADFVLICADEENFGRMRSLWAETSETKLKAMLWFDGASLRFGPLHIVGETACFGCYLKRLNASSHYVDEAKAYEAGDKVIPCGGGAAMPRGAEDLTAFVVKWVLSCIVAAQYNRLKPSAIYSWNMLDAVTDNAPVL